MRLPRLSIRLSNLLEAHAEGRLAITALAFIVIALVLLNGAARVGAIAITHDMPSCDALVNTPSTRT
jgi:hypothetical protein